MILERKKKSHISKDKGASNFRMLYVGGGTLFSSFSWAFENVCVPHTALVLYF